MPTDPPPTWAADRRTVIGSRLRDARMATGLSQEKLAELAGIDRRTVVRLEGGTSDARMTVWLCLARAVGIPLADLVREP